MFSMNISSLLYYFQYLIDVLFIIDLIINFYRGYYKNENLVKNNKLICIRYLINSFRVDQIDSIPIYTISLYLCQNFNLDGTFFIEGSISGKYLNLKILSIVKITRIYKIVFCSDYKVIEKFNN